MKKLNRGIISIQKGLREAKKERKKFSSRIPLKPEPGKKIPKKLAKKFAKLKNLFSTLFLAKTDRPRKREKIFVPNSVPTQPELENSKKIVKKFKNGLRKAGKEREKF